MNWQSGNKGGPWQSFSGPNLGYVMEMYELFVQNPEEVSPELRELFELYGSPTIEGDSPSVPSTRNLGVDTAKIVAAIQLADNIRTYGHLAADINPLGMRKFDTKRIELATYNLTEQDLRSVPVNLISKHAPSNVKDGYEAILHLKDVYTKKLAFEYSQVHDEKERDWLQQKLESGTSVIQLSNDEKKALLKRLSEVEGFETFVHRTFVGQKRFSIEGLDSMILLLDAIIQDSMKKGAKTINIGMAHRGRLNVLAHILGKPYEMIFAEFQHAPNKQLIPSEGSIGITYGWTGDVKYHLGANREVNDSNVKGARITLANNPSHLEVISPIVTGYTRAAQENRDEPKYPEQNVESSYAILIHGDAAFPGQGIVAETFNYSGIKGYQTGGSIHVIANNLIGFTTESYDSRSTKYASDPAKGFEVPIVHVNADDPESVITAGLLAYEYRHVFKKILSLILVTEDMAIMRWMNLWRIHSFIKIQNHPTPRALYGSKLVNSGIVNEETINQYQEEIQSLLKEAYEVVPKKDENPDIKMNPPEPVANGLPKVITKIPHDQLKAINEELLTWPEDLSINKKLGRILKRRSEVFEGKGKIDWAHAETLAFAGILNDGTPIRLTGQDSERGTFAQRHLVLHDEVTGGEYIPLHHLKDGNASFTVHNSPLTEAAVVGYEYGYNVFAPETLVLWEAQFGDFANMAQVMFDQFISSGRAKWGQKSGLVMLLPHGYEGQGPEHSSGRIERFLQSAAENNWTVANLSTAAQYFHILRRQAAVLQKEEIRPLVIMTPKSLLRHQLSSVSSDTLTEGEFLSVLEEEITGISPEKVEKLILCTGKVSIDLSEAVSKMDDHSHVHIARVEEIYPFPKEKILEMISKFPNLNEIVWVQEEPKNMGAWTFVQPLLLELNVEAEITYIGRRRRSSPSEGEPTVHKKEQERIITEALKRGVGGRTSGGN
ncbi:2-oxoglutarate dehydrogenase E1 component [Bacillus coahuilensis]|uniref:2-oxoglutarate dehydrogenase E1 component n=1 Tax=Bacillus coahuilensis TaxID=408580 RepID=UPI000A5B90EE|nr:2-oxoglutarate dehydrogenase E1 component [Bacillus coahuilensis]